jgi:hypothetical protein
MNLKQHFDQQLLQQLETSKNSGLNQQQEQSGKGLGNSSTKWQLEKAVETSVGNSS